jgi:hypothetical protein
MNGGRGVYWRNCELAGTPRAARSVWAVPSQRRACSILALLACACALNPALAFATQKKLRPKAPTPPAAKKIPPETPAPFHAGEELHYRVLWSRYAVNAASLQLAVVERRPFDSGEAWHFQAIAHTVETTRLIFALDDQFDSYSAPGDLVSLQYEMYLREQGKSENSILRMSSSRDPAPSSMAQARVPPGTRDALAFLQYLRQVDWARTPQIRSPVFDGRKLYDAQARLEKQSGSTSVPAGNFTASRVAVRVFERGKTEPMATFVVWLTLDAARTPVLFEADVPFGTARVELTRIATRK